MQAINYQQIMYLIEPGPHGSEPKTYLSKAQIHYL